MSDIDEPRRRAEAATGADDEEAGSEGSGDVIMGEGAVDDSSEEEESDPEEVQRVRQGFIVDEDEDDEDGDAEDEDVRKHKKRRKRRKKHREHYVFDVYLNEVADFVFKLAAQTMKNSRRMTSSCLLKTLASASLLALVAAAQNRRHAVSEVETKLSMPSGVTKNNRARSTPRTRTTFTASLPQTPTMTQTALKRRNVKLQRRNASSVKKSRTAAAAVLSTQASLESTLGASNDSCVPVESSNSPMQRMGRHCRRVWYWQRLRVGPRVG